MIGSIVLLLLLGWFISTIVLTVLAHAQPRIRPGMGRTATRLDGATAPMPAVTVRTGRKR